MGISMGLTHFSIDMLNKFITNEKSVIELGAQNIFAEPHMGAYANVYYSSRGIDYNCIDLNGENNAKTLDLSQPISIEKQYEIVTDFGTSEHVHGGKHILDWKAIYNCWKTKHDLLSLNGLMFNENPETLSWPKHGYNYYTELFYKEIAEKMNYQILELGRHAAMGNTTDGWNIYCVLKKVKDKPFMKLSEFKTLYLCQA